MNNIYLYKKKSYVITLFIKNIETIILKKQQYKKCLCFFQKKQYIKSEQIDLIISKFIYKNKLPIFIDEILKIYRYREDLTYDQIIQSQRADDLFLLLKYEQSNIKNCDKLNALSFDDKLNLIKKIICDIQMI